MTAPRSSRTPPDAPALARALLALRRAEDDWLEAESELERQRALARAAAARLADAERCAAALRAAAEVARASAELAREEPRGATPCA
jgi:multidrug resistance efflux pump